MKTVALIIIIAGSSGCAAALPYLPVIQAGTEAFVEVLKQQPHTAAAPPTMTCEHEITPSTTTVKGSALMLCEAELPLLTSEPGGKG